MKRFCALLFALLIVLPGDLAAQSSSPASSSAPPVLIYLRMKAVDPVNIEMTEDRIRRTLRMLDSLNSEFPSANIKATIFVNGAVSDELAQRNSKTGVQDLLLDSARKGLIEIGYDGEQEPRSDAQPLMDYRDVGTPKEDYLARVAVLQRILTEGRDPITGKPLPEADGGLKRMQQVFGEATSIRGTQAFTRDLGVGAAPDWGSDAELVQQIRLMNTRATMAGVLDDVPHFDFMYDDWVGPFSKNLSDSADASPDVYWQENRLRISERSDKSSQVVEASPGADAIKDYFDKLDRSKIRLVQINIGADNNYLQDRYRDKDDSPLYPPTHYAATHPNAPNLPKDALVGEADVDAGFQKEMDALKWVLSDFVAKNPGSQVVSNKDLLNMTAPCFGYRLATDSLRNAIAQLDKSWGDSPIPPKYVNVDGHYLSLAQTFEVLADALVLRRRTGKLPDSVEVRDVYGPVDMPDGTGAAAGEVSASTVSLAAVYILPSLYEDNWNPIPRNIVPGNVNVGNITVNAAQYMHLMMKALLSDDLEAKLPITPAGMVWAPVAMTFKTRPAADMGTIWTIKPAPIEISNGVAKNQ
jgi:hypothetical protein